MSSLFIYKRERHINIIINETNYSSTYIVRTVHAIPNKQFSINSRRNDSFIKVHSSHSIYLVLRWSAHKKSYPVKTISHWCFKALLTIMVYLYCRTRTLIPIRVQISLPKKGCSNNWGSGSRSESESLSVQLFLHSTSIGFGNPYPSPENVNTFLLYIYRHYETNCYCWCCCSNVIILLASSSCP